MIVRAEGHVSEVKWGPVGDGCADRGSCGCDARDRAGKCIRHDVRRAWHEHKDAWVLMYARWRCDILLRVNIRGLRSVVGSNLERPAFKSGAEMFDLIPETAESIALCRRSSNLPRFWIVFCSRNLRAAIVGLVAAQVRSRIETNDGCSNGSFHRVLASSAGGPGFDSRLRLNIFRCSMQRM